MCNQDDTSLPIQVTRLHILVFVQVNPCEKVYWCVRTRLPARLGPERAVVVMVTSPYST